jgi:hypothetical protein
MPSELETARAELSQLISDRDLPHILQRREECIRRHIQEHYDALSALEEQLAVCLHRRENIDSLILAAHDRIADLSKREQEARVAPAERQVKAILNTLSPAMREELLKQLGAQP